MKNYHTEYDKLELNDNLYISKLDNRSKAAWRFPYCLTSCNYDIIANFIDWGINNLGSFSPFEIYYNSDNYQNKRRLDVKWLVKTTSHYGSSYAEFYVRKEDLSTVLLFWNENGKSF